MATPNVVPLAHAPFALGLDTVNRIDELAYKATGIVRCIGLLGEHMDDVMPSDAVAGACWAAQSLIEEMQELAKARTGGQSA